MDADFFKNNRLHIAERLGGALIVLRAYCSLQRMNDMAFRFEQESNFWYLCGIEAPDWMLIIDGKTNSSWLVAPEREAVHVLFDGELDQNIAKKISGVDEVVSYDDGTALLRRLARQHSMVYTVDQSDQAKYYDFFQNPALHQNVKFLERTFNSVRSLNKDLAKQRAIKQPAEIKAIKKAVKLTQSAFEYVYKKLPTYTYEYQIEADFSYIFRNAGASGHAYDPIVATGRNACTMHYDENQNRLRSGQLVLMDVGARVDGYAADITRTVPYKSSTKRQKDVHDGVRNAQTEIIKLLGPELSVEEYSQNVDTIMRQTMKDLGILKSIDDSSYRTYFPHAISHGLGIDAHDSLGQSRVFEAGMVLTVEPGIYLPKEGFGVRIEDDILITNSGRTNLSNALSTGWR